MGTNYPTTVDSSAPALVGTDFEDTSSPDHMTRHNDLDDRTIALETKVGADGSAVPATIDFRLKNVNAGHNHDGVNSRAISGLSSLSPPGHATGNYFPIYADFVRGSEGTGDGSYLKPKKLLLSAHNILNNAGVGGVVQLAGSTGGAPPAQVFAANGLAGLQMGRWIWIIGMGGGGSSGANQPGATYIQDTFNDLPQAGMIMHGPATGIARLVINNLGNGAAVYSGNPGGGSMRHQMDQVEISSSGVGSRLESFNSDGFVYTGVHWSNCAREGVSIGVDAAGHAPNLGSFIGCRWDRCNQAGFGSKAYYYFQTSGTGSGHSLGHYNCEWIGGAGDTGGSFVKLDGPKGFIFMGSYVEFNNPPAFTEAPIQILGATDTARDNYWSYGRIHGSPPFATNNIGIFHISGSAGFTSEGVFFDSYTPTTNNPYYWLAADCIGARIRIGPQPALATPANQVVNNAPSGANDIQVWNNATQKMQQIG